MGCLLHNYIEIDITRDRSNFLGARTGTYSASGIDAGIAKRGKKRETRGKSMKRGKRDTRGGKRQEK
jgi:hypothetical protein